MGFGQPLMFKMTRDESTFISAFGVLATSLSTWVLF